MDVDMDIFAALREAPATVHAVGAVVSCTHGYIADQCDQTDCPQVFLFA